MRQSHLVLSVVGGWREGNVLCDLVLSSVLLLLLFIVLSHFCFQ